MTKIGIINLAGREIGGIAAYAASLIEGFNNYGKHEYFIFHLEQDPDSINGSANCKSIPIIMPSNGTRILSMLGWETKIDKIIKKNNLDLAICTSATLTTFQFGVPYIGVVHDLMHKYYRFPEYNFTRRLMRDLIYKKHLQDSLYIVADSVMTKNDLVRFYKAEKNKVQVIPFCPPFHIFKYKNLERNVIDKVINKYNLPEEFIFYPAQFWHHKNHIRLIKAIDLLRKNSDITVSLVLVGSKREAYDDVMKLIGERRLNNRIRHIGFVSDIELVALYKASKFLVYPSLIGPTNIPPLEAMVLGTPVVCSNLFSMPEQIGNAGLLIDPFNVEDIAKKIYDLWTNETLRRNLAEMGLEKAKNFTLEKFIMQWEDLIDKALTSKLTKKLS